MKNYDVVVIGSGVGGSAAVYALKDGGKSVALIEEDLWGGTCPNRGCDPKKVFVAGMEAAERSNQMAGKGLAPVHSIDWPELLAFKRTFTDPFPEAFRKNAQDHGIDTIVGSAEFINDTQIKVNGEIIEADNYIIAAGQRPGILDIEGKEYLKTSTDFLEMEQLPEKMTFLGAGYIAFELAAIANAAGSDVTIVHHNSDPLKGFDAGLVSDMIKAYQEKGIHFVFDVTIEKVSKEKENFLLTGNNYSAKTNCIICATGRIPNTEKLHLEAADIKYDRHGITVNEFMQTTNPSVFACGDIVSKKQPKLTPVAKFEGNYVAKKIFEDSLGAISYPPIASAVYGSPKLAAVGILISDTKNAPEKYSIREIDMTQWFTYRRIGETVSKAKLIYENGRLAGASALSSQADDLINYLAIMIGRGITKQEIGDMILGSPTIASDLYDLI